MKRSCGILMHITSLPSPYGIGTLGQAAYDFVDFLKAAGQSCWQILPLQPTGYGDSPYQPFSIYAGNPYLIDLEELCRRQLLTKEECEAVNWGVREDRVDFGALYDSRFKLLERAFQRGRDDPGFARFQRQNAGWLEDYTLYMAVKEEMGMRPWTLWDEDIKHRAPAALRRYRARLAHRIDYYAFLQYLFYEQWSRLKAYANCQGIRIIGDIPIYVAMDSADTWASSEVFLLDEKKRPIEVAGCPPDGFSATGQLWGNPLYRWERLKETSYAWWVNRIQFAKRLYDVIRIDHFRGLQSYYAIPGEETTAVNGEWRKGPGMEFFEAIIKNCGNVNFIAEDLGFLTPKVHGLRRACGFPGMKVLEFAFDSREESDYLPHNYEKNCVVYTGTHDNDTAAGWFQAASKEDRAYACRYMGIERPEEGHWGFIRTAYASVARLAVIQMQDFLGLGSECRMNIPATVGDNWRWRMKKDALTPTLGERIRSLAALYGRAAPGDAGEKEEESAND